MAPIVQALKLKKTYDTGTIKVDALRGVDLTIQKGEMVSIMGPSGCGKTTLLNCLSGLDDITSGRVIIEGQDLGTLSDNQKTEHRARRIGFIFQFYNLLPVLTALENVELPLLLGGIAPKEARDKSLAALGLVNMREWANHRPAELSGGQRQRTTIARALVNEPAIVFADEPTGDLDHENSLEVMRLMIRLNREKKQTFIIVTHNVELGEMAPRRIIMEDGCIRSDTGAARQAQPARKPAAKTARGPKKN